MVSYYIGETARNSYMRSIEHQEAVTKLQANNALGKYALEYHDGREITLDMWVTSIHKDPLTRQIQEGVSIVAGEKHKRDSELPHLLLNSKTEYLQGVVPQTRTTRGSISWSVINQLLSNNCIFESNFCIFESNFYFWKQFLKTVYYY